MGARKQGKGKYGTYPHPRCKMYKARFVSITTSWFAQKELKSLPPSTYHRLIIAAAGELAALPQTFNDGRGLPSLPKNPAPTLGPSGLVSTGLRV